MRMIKTLLTIGIGILFLQGCAVNPSLQVLEKTNVSPVVQVSPIEDRLAAVPAIDGPKITIAVYGFRDATGQRKPADNIANLSSAVTQGSEVWVIKALQDVGNGVWFEVVERVGMDNLIKERQLIRSTREVYEKELPNGPTPLKPMLFAGLILEGGIVGYDSNTAVGGVGARYLGVGAQTEYRVDTVTVVMRLVSVNTGKVLMSIATEKTIASYRSGADIFKFFDLGTKLVEAETGYSVNEPVNYAVRAAIEQGIIELVHEGNNRDMWKFVDGVEGIIDTEEGVKKAFPEVFPEAEVKQEDTVPDIN
jgi:curli production assembly/transport component CsgG